MIEARELRIGNWVQWDDPSHEQVQVESISYINHTNHRQYFVNGGIIDDFLAIPLSTYWLERFTIDQYGAYYQAGADSWSLVDDSGDGVTIYLGSCKYVHQLQNLYFALTGTELEFTLDTPQT
jgi:hypothetical protein